MHLFSLVREARFCMWSDFPLCYQKITYLQGQMQLYYGSATAPCSRGVVHKVKESDA